MSDPDNPLNELLPGITQIQEVVQTAVVWVSEICFRIEVLKMRSPWIGEGVFHVMVYQSWQYEADSVFPEEEPILKSISGNIWVEYTDFPAVQKSTAARAMGEALWWLSQRHGKG